MRDANFSCASSAARTTNVARLAALVIGIFVAATAFVVVPRSAVALPAYAQQVGKACGYCHANPAGGGARNAKGKEFEANGHKFKK